MKFVTASVIAFVAAGVVVFASQTPPAVLREFPEAVTLDRTNGPSANVSIGDLDGDGDLDIVLAKGRHDGVVDRVLLNDGKGHFTAKDLSPRDDASYSALLADIDRDGDLDIVVSNGGEAKVLYTNDGQANFQLAGEWGTVGPTRNATLADLNGDGLPDVIAANRSPRWEERSTFCLGDGRGRFPVCGQLPVGPATTIVAADFDRDGHVDLAAPHRDGGQSLILYNDGKAGFGRTAPFGPKTTAARAAAAGDLNGDGWPDLVMGDQHIDAVIYLNDGTGGLLPGLQLKFDRLGSPYSMAIADLNRDGHADIVIGYSGSPGAVLYGDGTGRSFRRVRFGDDSAAVYGLAIGDLDGDGYPEIVAARSGGPDQVFFNRPGPGAEIIGASDHFTSPDRSMALPEPEPRAPWNPIVGVWRGLVQDDPKVPYYNNVELRLEQSDAGELSGTTWLVTNGIGYCRMPMMLKERKPDGTFAFIVTENDCGTPPIQLKWIDDEHLQWQLLWSPSYGFSGALERKPLSPNPAKGDLDGDGRPDCPSDARTGHKQCVEVPAPFGDFARRAVADFDRDGHVDFASPAAGVIIFGDGHGGVARTAPGPKDGDAHLAVAGDVNGDGWPDLILANRFSGVFVHFNDRHGHLQTAKPFARVKPDGAYAMTDMPVAIAVGDLNGDGRPDLVLAGEKDSAVLLNDGTGLGFVEVKAADASAHGIVLKDVDGDGSPDLVMSDGLMKAAIPSGRPGAPSPAIVVTDRVKNAIPYLDPIALDPNTPMVGVWRGTVNEPGGATYPVEVQIDHLALSLPAGRMIYGFTNVYYCGSPLVLNEINADAYTFQGTFNVGWGCNWDNRVELRMLSSGRLQLTALGGKFRAGQTTILERKTSRK